jgi:aspartate racemase
LFDTTRAGPDDGGRLGNTGHIGIVAVSPEGASLCYRQIFRHAAKLFPDREPPCITIHNEPLPKYIECVRSDDWQGVADLLMKSVRVLQLAGCEFVLTPDNAVQHGVMIAEHSSPLPWLTMTDLVANALVERQIQTVGILGTRYVTQGSAYQTALGLKGVKLQVPDGDDVDRLDEILFKELIYGFHSASSEKSFAEIADRLRERGSEALIIAASELRLIIDEIELPIPTFDAADLLAVGAVIRAAEG